MNIRKILRKIVSIVLRYIPSEKLSDMLLWPISKRLFGKSYVENVIIKKGLSIKTYGDMEDMVNKLLLFTSAYMPLAWEPGTARLAEVLAPQSQCSAVAGSHIGYYPLILGFGNPNSKVFAFEPNPLNRERCKENVQLNRLESVEVSEYALGNTSGEKRMFFDYGQSSFIDSTRPHAGSGVVKVITLDEFFKGKNIKPDLLVLDAEGYEPQILKGGEKLIEENHPDIIFELNPTALEKAGFSSKQLCDSFIQKGYLLYVIDEGRHGILYEPTMKIKLVPHSNFSFENVSFINIFATINYKKIQTYVHTN